MRMRMALLVTCVGVIVYAAAHVLASPETNFVCCASMDDCAFLGWTCCDPESVGVLPCAEDAPGVCLKQCLWIGG